MYYNNSVLTWLEQDKRYTEANYKAFVAVLSVIERSLLLEQIQQVFAFLADEGIVAISDKLRQARRYTSLLVYLINEQENLFKELLPHIEQPLPAVILLLARLEAGKLLSKNTYHLKIVTFLLNSNKLNPNYIAKVLQEMLTINDWTFLNYLLKIIQNNNYLSSAISGVSLLNSIALKRSAAALPTIAMV